MARRRHQFDVGDFVQVAKDGVGFGAAMRITMKMYDEVNDTFNYRVEGGWVEEKNLLLVTPYQPVITPQIQENE
jgi:hypothetical protein